MSLGLAVPNAVTGWAILAYDLDTLDFRSC
jgi:hypothetical protein